MRSNRLAAIICAALLPLSAFATPFKYEFSGIVDGGVSTIVGNNCRANSGRGTGAGNGSGRGINAGSFSEVRDNRCDSHSRFGGAGTARGILAAGDCVIENNHCTGNLGFGIEITGANNVVSSNKTSGNNGNTVSILYPTPTTIRNRTELNRCREALPTNAPTTAGDFGTGDLADIAF